MGLYCTACLTKTYTDNVKLSTAFINVELPEEIISVQDKHNKQVPTTNMASLSGYCEKLDHKRNKNTQG